jgi:hypothetical protein
MAGTPGMIGELGWKERLQAVENRTVTRIRPSVVQVWDFDCWYTTWTNDCIDVQAKGDANKDTAVNGTATRL